MSLSFISIVLCCWLNSANNVAARERGRSIATSVSGLNKDGTFNARPRLLPFCRRKLKRSAAKDLPLRRPNTALIHRILWLDVEIHYVTSGVRKYLAGAKSERDVLDVVKSVERPVPRRPEVEATVKIVDSEWLHRRELANRA